MHPVLRTILGLLAVLAARPASAAEPNALRLPDGSALEQVDFDRHVASLFGRLGCNAGACHGSFQGRGGLNLSLFGHDPARDYATLTRNALGRRVDVIDPDRSLVLLKPTGQVPHEGGQRFKAGSWEYRVIRAWIAEGARRDPSRAAVERIEIRPGALNLERPGGSGRLSVVARFADGDLADVTPFCDLHVRDDAVALVSLGGEVRGLRPGDTAVVASYNGRLASARVSVPTGRVVTVPEVPECDVIDREVFAKLRSLGVAPSRPASDAEFLRRVTLDLIGTLPAPQEVRAFLRDGASDKRSKKIDELLAHPMHAALWATRFLDITGCDVGAMEGPENLRPRRARMWHDWFRKRFADNTRYSEIARGVITATSQDGGDADAWVAREAARMIALKNGAASDYACKPGLDLYWRRFASGEYVAVEPLAERTAAAFLGVRVECAQCHKHPFDRWTQGDYRAFANVFADVQFGLDVLNTALGVAGDFGADAPKGARAIEIATNRVASADLARVFRIFGRPARVAICDCERPGKPAMPQTLFLMTDAALFDKIKSGRLKGLVGSDRCDAEVVEEMFLATLSRFPDDDEAPSALDHLRKRPDRASGFADLVWALINTREFVLNH